MVPLNLISLRSFMLTAACLIPLAACGPTESRVDLDDEESLATEDQELRANAWQYQPLDLSCSSAVFNSVARTTRRHFYGFEGVANETVTFELNAAWPASYGAAITIKDSSGTVLGSYVSPRSASAKVDVTFAHGGKHFVYVSPYHFRRVHQKYGYNLGARCHTPWCRQDSDCAPEEMCALPVCITFPCDFPGRCVPRPIFCATVTTQFNDVTNPTYVYAKNVGSQAEADAWFTNFSSDQRTSVLTGSCAQDWACTEQYAPVCGAIRNDPPETYSNSCFFSAAIKVSAGNQLGQESKGYYRPGACP